MLSKEAIESNKKQFIALTRSISREGYGGMEKLIEKLEKSDFFTAPASTKYHGAYEGGLCEHSLHVYENLTRLVVTIYDDGKESPFEIFSEDTIKIVSLFHDISKINYYNKSIFNKKVYDEEGSKHDELGNFDWKSEYGFTVKEAKDRYLFGTHGQNSERMLSYFVPLSEEESCAIINHHSVYDNPSLDISPIYNKYSLAVLLHVADMISTYIDEKVV